MKHVYKHCYVIKHEHTAPTYHSSVYVLFMYCLCIFIFN